MNEISFGIMILFLLLGLFLTGIELAFAMALLGFIGYASLTDFEAGCTLLVKDLFDTFTSYSLSVIPLFVLMGQVTFHSGIAKKLYGASYKFVGHIPGGLAMTTVVGATLFKAMCGSTPATAATFASLAVPEMNKYGYDRRLSTGVVASVGSLGCIIPPSITLILFGLVTEVSIGRLFLAGIIPGLIISFFFMAVIYGWVKVNPTVAPPGERASWKGRLHALPEFLGVAIVFLVIMGGLMTGMCTPTEAGTIGTVSVLIFAFIRERFDLKGLVKSFDESLKTACMVLAILAGSTVLGHFLAITEIPMIAADWIVGLNLNRNLIMILIMLIYLLGGSFIDDLAFMILATPIFYPAIVKLGYDPIWFGIVIAITIMIGTIIPPVAMCVFVVKNITGESFKTIYDGVYPFLLSLVGCAILVFIFPGIATFLPRLIMK